MEIRFALPCRSGDGLSMTPVRHIQTGMDAVMKQRG